MNPAERLTAVDALRHPYFDGMRYDDFVRKISSNAHFKHEAKLSSIVPSNREEEHKPSL